MKSVRTEKAEYNCISLNKNVSKSISNMLKYRLLFKDIFTFLRLDFGDASLITLIIMSNKKCYQKGQNSICFKRTYGHSGNAYWGTALIVPN